MITYMKIQGGEVAQERNMQVDPKNGTVVQRLNGEVLYLIGFFAFY